MKHTLNFLLVSCMAYFLIMSSCAKEEEPLVSGSIVLSSGGDLTAIVNTQLADPVVVQVKDQNGDGFAGATVKFCN